MGILADEHRSSNTWRHVRYVGSYRALALSARHAVSFSVCSSARVALMNIETFLNTVLYICVLPIVLWSVVLGVRVIFMLCSRVLRWLP